MAQSNSKVQGIAMKVAIGDPDYPSRVLKPNADGSINVAGGGDGIAEGHVTAAAPSYADGTDEPLSMDLEGNLRVTDSQVLAALELPVPFLPPIPASPLSEVPTTRGTINFTGVTGDQEILPNVSGQTNRVYRFFCTVTGNASETLIIFKSGATPIGYARIPTAGGIIDLSFQSAPHFSTAVDEDLFMSPSVACNLAGWFDAVTSA